MKLGRNCRRAVGYERRVALRLINFGYIAKCWRAFSELF